MQKQISELAVTPRHLLLLASRTPYVRTVLECTVATELELIGFLQVANRVYLKFAK